MKPLLQTPLFRIGTAAMATAAAGVIALFIYALNAPTQPELQASTDAPLVSIQVSAASER